MHALVFKYQASIEWLLSVQALGCIMSWFRKRADLISFKEAENLMGDLQAHRTLT